MTEVQRIMSGRMTEDELLEAVIELAQYSGWLVMHIPDRLYQLAAKEKRWDAMVGAKSFPDLILVDPVQRIMIVAELKSQKGRVRPEQGEWLNALERTFRKATTPRTRDRLMVKIWRPDDWLSGEIESTLRGET